MYPIVAGMLSLVFHNPKVISDICYVVFGALLVMPIFLVSRTIYGTRTAWVAVVLLAVFPILTVSVLYWTLSEPLYIFLVYSGLAALLYAFELSQPWLFLAAGVLFGLAYLTRPEGFVYLAVLSAFALVGAAFGYRTERKSEAIEFGQLRRPLLMLVGFTIVATPYVVYLHGQTHRWLLTTKSDIVWDTDDSVADHDWQQFAKVNGRLDSTGKEVMWFSPERLNGPGLLHRITSNPKVLWHRITRNVRSVPRVLPFKRLSEFILLPLALLGLLCPPWDRRRLWDKALLVVAFVPVLMILIFHVELRYISPMFPVVLMWIAAGVVGIGKLTSSVLERSRVQVRSNARIGLQLFPAIVLVSVFVLKLPTLAKAEVAGVAGRIYSYQHAGEWFRQHVPPHTAVLSREPSIMFYADVISVPRPYAPLDKTRRYARVYDAKYMITDDWEIRQADDGYTVLLSEKTRPPDIKLVYRTDDKVAVYIFALAP